MLSPQLLELLRAWWREGRRRSLLLPGGWLFPGRNPVEPLSARQLSRVVRAAAEAAGARLAAHTAAQLCHPPARARCRYSRDPDAPGLRIPREVARDSGMISPTIPI
jgi:integrase